MPDPAWVPHRHATSSAGGATYQNPEDLKPAIAPAHGTGPASSGSHNPMYPMAERTQYAAAGKDGDDKPT